MSESQEILDLKRKIEHWKSLKKSRNDKIPKEFKLAILDLEKKYPRTVLRKKLGASSAFFTKNTSRKSMRSEIVFQEIPSQSSLKLEVHLPNGVILKYF